MKDFQHVHISHVASAVNSYQGEGTAEACGAGGCFEGPLALWDLLIPPLGKQFIRPSK